MLVDPAEVFVGTVLIAAPHMDDEALACGGTITRLPQKERIHVVYATDGTMSPAPIVPWRDSVGIDLSQVRMDESRAAMRFLGVPEENMHFLVLPEADLKNSLARLEEELGRLIAVLKPETILIPFRYDRHPDHLAVNQVMTRMYEDGACGKANLYEYFVYYRWRLLPRKDIRQYILPKHLIKVDITGVAERKRSMLDFFRSQTTIYYPWQTRPILRPVLLDEECHNPEQFLRYDSSTAGDAVFAGLSIWIRIAHRLEPFLQKWKYRVTAFLKRQMGYHASSAG